MKYKLTEDTKSIIGKTVYRIESLKDFSDVKKGDKGGYVESENNLSHDGDCWLYHDALCMDFGKVYENGKVYDRSIVRECGAVYGNAVVQDRSQILGTSKILDDAKVYKNTDVHGTSSVFGKSVCTKPPITLNGNFFPVTITDNRVNVGFKSLTFQEWMKFTEHEARMYGVADGDLARLKQILTIFHHHFDNLV